MILCLNLATWATEQAGIFTGSNPLTPLDPVADYGKYNGTSLIEDITHSQDPTGGTDYVNVGLGLLGGFLSGAAIGFPAWVFSIPWVPTYLSWMIVIMWTFVYAVFIIEFASGRNISGDS